MMDNIDTHIMDLTGLYAGITFTMMLSRCSYNNSFCSMIKEFLFQISYILEQAAVDTGKVCRDLYLAFWDIAYVKHYGERLLVPAVTPTMDLQILYIYSYWEKFWYMDLWFMAFCK